MNKKGIAICAACAIALGGVAGYVLINESPNAVVSQAVADDKKPDNKIFAPGKHCYWRFYNPRTLVGQVSVPEGYEILDIEASYDYYVGSYIVWFINTETVEAEAVLSEIGLDRKYYYSKPGKVVKKEKEKTKQK